MTDTKTKTERITSEEALKLANRDIQRDERQRMLLNSDLFTAVLATDEALRSRSEYDRGTAELRRFAILCYALEQSALHTAGTSLTLAGVYRTLNALKEEA
jgi:hypothetical protein